MHYRAFRKSNISFTLAALLLVLFYKSSDFTIQLQVKRVPPPSTSLFNSTQASTNGSSITDSSRVSTFNEELLQNSTSTIVGSYPPSPRHQFFTEVFNIVSQGNPKISKIGKFKSAERIPNKGHTDDELPLFTEEYLSNFIQLKPHDVDSMIASHKLVVDGLKTLKIPEGIFHGDGVVYVGGGRFTWLSLLSIKHLRYLGSELPVEVLIPDGEYEANICEDVLPKLNAKCIMLRESLGETAYKKWKMAGYQYKILAILASSFENVLLLDADNIPAHKFDHIFYNEPFNSSGLVVWPDFWRRSTSPDFYKIAGITIGDVQLPKFKKEHRLEKYIGENMTEVPLDKLPLHQRIRSIPDPTTESGQVLVSKKTHFKEMALAFYYNINGPNYFYPLFSQGCVGEGDKETFLAATVVMNSTFYQVQRTTEAFGHFNDGNFRGTAMGQFDPTEDYTYFNSNKTTKSPGVLFVHANFPKLNPWLLKEMKYLIREDGSRRRIYGTGINSRVKYDFELNQWLNMYMLICENHVTTKSFNGNSWEVVCKEVKEQMVHLEKSAKDNER